MKLPRWVRTTAWAMLVGNVVLAAACGDDGTTDDDAAAGVGTGLTMKLRHAADVDIDYIEVNQGVGIAVVDGGVVVDPSARSAPLLAGRPGVWRVFWKLDPNFEERTIQAHLELSYADGTSQTLSEQRLLSGEPRWDTLDGSFAFALDAEAIRPGMSWQVLLFEVGDPAGITSPETPTAIPTDAAADLGIAAAPMNLNVVIVPSSPSCTLNGPWLLSAADESNIRNQIYNTYPLTTLNVQFHAPVVLDAPDCDDSPGILAALSELRESENLGPNYYYHAVFPHADDDMMPSGGFAWIIEDASMGADLVSYSVNFWPEEPNNVTHEMGHNHGQLHSFNDPDYLPNGPENANCGRRSSWGFGIGQWQHPFGERRMFSPLNNVEGWLIPPTDQLLLDPSAGSCASHPEAEKGPAMNDVMSYADPYWVSSYSYAAFAKRIATLSLWDQLDWQAAPERRRQSLHGTFLADGTTRWRLHRGVAAAPARRRLDSHHHARLRGEAAVANGGLAPADALPVAYKRSGDGSLDGVIVVLPANFEVPIQNAFEVTVAGMVRSGDWAEVPRRSTFH